MGKKGSKKFASRDIDFESDNEEMFDEIDQHHRAQTAVSDTSYRRKKVKRVDEVLNVEGDLEESDGEESDSDFDDKQSGEDDDGISKEKWGKKRKDFYGATYVDKDWGGMGEDELEDAELEERDALIRQKTLDSAAEHVAELLDNDDEEATADAVVEAAEVPWEMNAVKKVNKKTVELLKEYDQRRELMEVIVAPLIDIIPELPENSSLRKQFQLVYDVYSSYVLNLMYYLKIKSDSFCKEEVSNELVDNHPVLQQINRLKKAIAKVDDYLFQNSRSIDRIKEAHLNGKLATLSLAIDQGNSNKVPKMSIPAAVEEEINEEAPEHQGPYQSKRAANKTITKNAEVQPSSKSKKKQAKISKTKNRKKFDKISKKVRSQVGVMRKEFNQYSGEARGIRAGLVRSTKLVA